MVNLYVEAVDKLDFKVPFDFLYSSSEKFYPSIWTENLPHSWKVIYIYSFVYRKSSIDTTISRRCMSGCPTSTQNLSHPAGKDAKERRGDIWASLAVLGSEGHI